MNDTPPPIPQPLPPKPYGAQHVPPALIRWMLTGFALAVVAVIAFVAGAGIAMQEVKQKQTRAYVAGFDGGFGNGVECGLFVVMIDPDAADDLDHLTRRAKVVYALKVRAEQMQQKQNEDEAGNPNR